MNNEKLITFFMLVTDYDIYIADYSVNSYNILFKMKEKNLFPDFNLYIYANCVSKQNKYYLTKWIKLPFVVIYDNSNLIKDKHFKATDLLISPEGIERPREGVFESCDEVWSNELKKFNSKYIATVDADFEILNSRFIIKILKELEEDTNIAVYSTDHDETRLVYDTYLNEKMILSERWHTWFCVYRKSTYSLERSHFFYRFLMPNNMSYVYDSGAYLQDLIKKHYKMEYLSDYKFQQDFIHYGAFAKNKNLNKDSIRIYRILAIYSKIGFFRTQWLPLKVINYVIKKLSLTLLSSKFQSEINERKYHH
jgi:hypothetical protein